MEVRKSLWGAVFALSIGTAGLIVAEFLPVGVLTPIANDLHVSEGMAGQAVSSSAVIATITSLLIAFVTRKYNRRTVLLGLTLFQILSSLIVAIASNYTFLIVGRLFLGISIGGFWAMATAIAIRLVKEEDVPKAVSLVFGGSSFATIFAAPMGSYLGQIVGWRNVFFISAALGLVAFIWQYITLPSLEPVGVTRFKTILHVFKRPNFAIGMLAVILMYGGRFASFTYMRPFLEKTTGVSVDWISIILLIFGLAYFIGNSFAPRLIRSNIYTPLILPPICSAILTIGIILWGNWLVPTLIMILMWGILFGPLPSAWSTWVSRKASEHAETAGGIFIASIQFSAAIGALLGGIAFDHFGSTGAFSLSGLCWIGSAGLVFLIRRSDSVLNSEQRIVSTAH